MPRKAAQPPIPDVNPAPGGVASVDRALSLLSAFSTEAPLMTLSELADSTRQYKSTVLRLLASLECAHLVRRQPDGRFSLGSAVARLHAVYATSFSIAEIVMPALRDLVALTQESAAFHVRQGEHDLCLHRVDSPHPVRDHTQTGDLHPLKNSVAGQVLWAYTGGHSARHLQIRRQQLLVADGNIVPELAGIAAPVFGAGGEFAGTIVLTMPSTRMLAGYATEVKKAAQRVSHDLGGSYPNATRS